MNLMLMQNGYPPVNIKYADRKSYYEAFDAYYRDHNEGVMLTIVTDMLKENLQRFLKLREAMP